MKLSVFALLAVLVLALAGCVTGSEANDPNNPGNGADVTDESDTPEPFHPGTSGDVTDEASVEVCGPRGCDVSPADTTDPTDTNPQCGPRGCDLQSVDTNETEEETTPVVCNPVACEDGNTCTLDACVNEQCARAAKPDGQGCFIGGENGLCHSVECKNNTVAGGCYDANPCTADAVINGQCVNSSIVCSDNNPCTADVCTSTGTDSYSCSHTPLSACNQCATDLDCDDHNPCTGADNTLPDKCVNGTCVRHDKPDYVPCTSGATWEYCVNGACVDFNCDDGDACTTDSFNSGVCKHVAIPNCHVLPPQCAADIDCNEGNACQTGYCDAARCFYSDIENCTACVNDSQCQNNAKVCSTTATTVLYTFNGECIEGVCQRTWQHCANGCENAKCLGACVNNADCDDANPCSDDSCVDGECQHPMKLVCKKCTADSQCLDQDYCVDAAHLAKASGECQTDGLCEYSDLLECPLGCEGNQCRECVADVNCDDGQFCTTDTCNAGQCQFVAKTNCQADLTQCDTDADCVGNATGHYCTTDSYHGGQKFCQACKPYVPTSGTPDVGVADLGCGGNLPLTCLYADYTATSLQKYSRAFCGECLDSLDCNDGDACTVDSCVGTNMFSTGTQCHHDVQSLCKTCSSDSQCNDNNPLTYDHCVANTCAFTSSCTTDSECGSLSCVAGKCGVDPSKVTCKITCPSGYDAVMVWHGQTSIQIVNGGTFTGSTVGDLCSWDSPVPVFDFNCVWGSGDKALLECSSTPTITAHPDGGGKQTAHFYGLSCNK